MFFFFFKQKTAYEMRISDWSSDVCSSDLASLLAQCARIGAQRGTADDFVRLDLAIDELETRVNSSADHLKAIGPATEFYRLAARSTYNPLMVLLVDALANLVAERLTSLRHPPRQDPVTAARTRVG